MEYFQGRKGDRAAEAAEETSHMARPVRAEHPGSYHHVTTRGVARGDIFLADADRHNESEATPSIP